MPILVSLGASQFEVWIDHHRGSRKDRRFVLDGVGADCRPRPPEGVGDTEFEIRRRWGQLTGDAYGASRRKILEVVLIVSSIARVCHLVEGN